MNDAVRATVEASRRTITSAQEAARFSRDLYEQSTDASRKLFAAYTAGLTAGLKASFELQNASLAAGVSLIETTSTSNRELVKQFTDTAHQMQKATLEAWEAGMRAADKFAAGEPKSGSAKA
jgi:hypothetical protein